MIFLSHAKEDKLKIHDIFRTIRGAGLTVWMDSPPSPFEAEGIPPGQDWDSVIRRQLQQSRFVLLFLSAVSIAKQGYFQKEVRLALNIASTRPLNEGYLIPTLLENCDVPPVRVDTVSLHDLQWYKLYELGLDGLIVHLKRKFGLQAPPSPVSDPAIALTMNELRNEIAFLKNEVAWQQQQHEKHVDKLQRTEASLRDELTEHRVEDRMRSMHDTFRNF
jgi:hypothetical protein